MDKQYKIIDIKKLLQSIEIPETGTLRKRYIGLRIDQKYHIKIYQQPCEKWGFEKRYCHEDPIFPDMWADNIIPLKKKVYKKSKEAMESDQIAEDLAEKYTTEELETALRILQAKTIPEAIEILFGGRLNGKSTKNN